MRGTPRAPSGRAPPGDATPCTPKLPTLPRQNGKAQEELRVVNGFFFFPALRGLRSELCPRVLLKKAPIQCHRPHTSHGPPGAKHSPNAIVRLTMLVNCRSARASSKSIAPRRPRLMKCPLGVGRTPRVRLPRFPMRHLLRGTLLLQLMSFRDVTGEHGPGPQAH